MRKYSMIFTQTHTKAFQNEYLFVQRPIIIDNVTFIWMVLSKIL